MSNKRYYLQDVSGTIHQMRLIVNFDLGFHTRSDLQVTRDVSIMSLLRIDATLKETV